MFEIKDLGFGIIEIFDKNTQYAPAQSIKIGNNTYIREDLINKQIADLQHRLEVAEKAVELAISIANIKSNHLWTSKELKEKAEAEINKRSNNDE